MDETITDKTIIDEKRYFSFSDYIKTRFPYKVCKVSIDTNFGCAHKEHGGGCAFCSLLSYRPSYIDHTKEVEEQWLKGCDNARKRYKKYYAYFQMGTPLEANVSADSLLTARKLINYDECVGLMFGARSDMTEKSVLNELNILAGDTGKEVWLEMGIQSTHDETLNYINRGHSYNSFVSKVNEIHDTYKNIFISTHVIFGLPKAEGIIESESEMLETILRLNELPIKAVKYHHLQIVENSLLADIYKKSPFETLKEAYYIELICKVVSLTNPNIIIARLLGDSHFNTLIAPIWGTNKSKIISKINKSLEDNNIFQGCLLSD